MNTTHGLPAGWTRTTLENVALIHDDLRLPVNAEERSKRPGPYPYYGATGQVGWIDDYRLDGSYVLLGEDGAPFLDPVKPKAYMVEGKCWVNNHAHVLHAVEGLSDNRFLMYALNAVNYQGVVNGTTRLKLTQAAMRQIPIHLPPFAEQRRIVATIEEPFTRLDAGVAALRSAQTRLKHYRAAVLKAAVEGKLTEAWRAANPADEPADALLGRILAERRTRWEADLRAKGKDPAKARYQESADPDMVGLPELPAGWCVASLEQLTSAARPICYGILMPKDNLADGVPYVKVKDMRGDRIDVDALHKTAPEIAAAYARAALKPGDVLLAIRGTYGRVAEVPPELDGANITQDTARLAVSEHVRANYVAAHLRSPDSQQYFRRVARGVAVKGVNIADVRLTPIMLPPLAEQEQIVAEVERRLSVIAELESVIEANLRRADRVRQSVLLEAFAGRLVPQDPADEPASTLLERIHHEREGRLAGASRPASRGRREQRESGPAPSTPVPAAGLPPNGALAHIDGAAAQQLALLGDTPAGAAHSPRRGRTRR